MTVGRFFANFSVVSGSILGTANTLFAQRDWGYPLVGGKPNPTPEEIKNMVDGGWFTWPVVAWVALALAILALLLHFWRRRGNSAPPPSPPPNEGGMNYLGDINGGPTPPPPPSEKKDEKLKEGEPATNVRWEIKRGKVEKGDKKAEEPNQPQPPPAAPPFEEKKAEGDKLSETAPPPSPDEKSSETAPPPPTTCVVCSAPLKIGVRYCAYCGQDQTEPVQPVREGTAVPPPSSDEKKEVANKGKGNSAAAAAATGLVMLALVMFGFAGFANAAPVIDFCTPPLLAWDGQPRTFECFGTDLQSLAGAKVTNIKEVTGTVVRSTPTTATIRLVAVRNLSALYNSVDFAIGGNRIGKPILLVSPEEAGKYSFLRNAILREAKMLPATPAPTGTGTSTATTPPVVDKQARKDAAEALRLAREAMAKSGRSDPAAMSRIIALEEGLKTRLTEAEILTVARQEATTATATIRSEVDGAKKAMVDGLETATKEMRAGLEKVEATTRDLASRVGTVETSTARDRAVLQATACAVVADNGGWLGQGPSNRHKKAIRAASTSAGYPACPKK